MKIVSLNMTTAGSTCPPGLKTLQDPQPLCAMNTDSPGCSSTVLEVQGVQYSRVCGKIIGYQQKSPDAFRAYSHRGQTTIESYYVDGISITHGSPCKHNNLDFCYSSSRVQLWPGQCMPMYKHAQQSTCSNTFICGA